jgi:endonuclease G, mitochondrial
MFRNQIEQVRRNTRNYDELADKVLTARKAATGDAERPFEAMVEHPSDSAFAEAIILSELRPAYFLRDDGIDLTNAITGDPDLVAAITANKVALEKVSDSVGRIDLVNHFTLPYGGTGFLITEDIAVTNRHVADVFAQGLRGGYRFRKGRFGNDIEAQLDYRHLHESTAKKRAEVIEVLYIAKDNEPDFALLRVARLDDVVPLTLARERIAPQMPVAVVGYPAQDGDRNDQAIMDRVFGGVYQVKRLAPGFVTARQADDVVLMADYSSLGGNSGSPVISLTSGEVVGLHFSGRFRENNYAVSSDMIAAAQREVSRVRPPVGVLTEGPVTPVADLAGRNGYDPDFLGQGALRVPLPDLGAWETAPVSDAADMVLRYRNFSTIQSVKRRLPLVTAVNIDGALSKVLKREGDWKLDGRIAAEHQIGNALYASNPLDRGHMVRRRDPGWGDGAEQGEMDTFHYTNSAPQHEDLNQIDWVGLEDYVLEAAETKGFRVSVLTGPVFRDTDHRLKAQPGAGDILIPEEFWKIAVIVNAATGALSATGYVLSHGPMIRDLIESPFIYGSYKTYQVQIARIEAATGLRFGTLTAADPLGATLATEAPFAAVARVVAGPDSLVLGPRPGA